MNMDNISDVRRCLVCFNVHPLRYCKKFELFTPQQKLYSVRVHGYCSNCFSRSHTIGECTSSNGCSKCGELHHTMLHGALQSPSSSTRRVRFAVSNQPISIESNMPSNRKQFVSRTGRQGQGPQQQEQHQKIQKRSMQQSYAQYSNGIQPYMEQNHQVQLIEQLTQLSELTQIQNQDQSNGLAVQPFRHVRRPQQSSGQSRQQHSQGPNHRPGIQRSQQQQNQHAKPQKKLQGINKKNQNIKNIQGTKMLLSQMMTTLTRLNRALNVPI